MRKDVDDLISMREAAKIAGVSHVTIWRWIQSGKLEGVRIAGHLLVERSKVAKLAGSAK